ncbi:MAG TPA: TonB-dependent receptor plug domain-containing protein, partial [Myxococcaceae bacterium]|nr:TonB-dependent receptor plug domain-containing protein [Myxococcaceae bacterium]
MRVLPLSRPDGLGGANRSFESVATVAPQTAVDLYGVSINGASSPENLYLVDGLAVNDPGYGTAGTPLTTEFMEEVNVVTGGYLPEYGRAMGGVISAVTRSGGNEFHGSVFGTFAPGVLTGAPRVSGTTGTVQGAREVGNAGDVGATLGGYIIKDRLWFFTGIQWAAQRSIYSRSFSRFIGGAFEPIPESTQRWNGDERSINYIGKLTYLVNSDHRLSLSISGSPTTGGGSGGLSLRDRSTARTVHPANYLTNATYGVNALQTTFGALDLVAQLNSSFLQKKLLLDVRVGWHHQHDERLPNDGSTLDDVDAPNTLAGTPQVRSPVVFGLPVYTLDPSVPASVRTACTSAGATCNVRTFLVGGAGMLETLDLDSFQARAVLTALVSGAGHHVLKVGFDGQISRFRDVVARSGGSTYRNASDLTGQQADIGAVWDAFQYGTL